MASRPRRGSGGAHHHQRTVGGQRVAGGGRYAGARGSAMSRCARAQQRRRLAQRVDAVIGVGVAERVEAPHRIPAGQAPGGQKRVLALFLVKTTEGKGASAGGGSGDADVERQLALRRRDRGTSWRAGNAGAPGRRVACDVLPELLAGVDGVDGQRRPRRQSIEGALQTGGRLRQAKDVNGRGRAPRFDPAARRGSRPGSDSAGLALPHVPRCANRPAWLRTAPSTAGAAPASRRRVVDRTFISLPAPRRRPSRQRASRSGRVRDQAPNSDAIARATATRRRSTASAAAPAPTR